MARLKNLRHLLLHRTISVSIRLKLTAIVLVFLLAFAGVIVFEVRSRVETMVFEELLLTMGGAVLLAIVAAGLLTSLVLKPIHHLVKATEALRSGDFQQRVPVASDDEVGRLGASFNAMAEAFARSQRELEEVNQQLRCWNAHLSVTNSLAMIVSGSLELEDILNSAVDGILKLLPFGAGWVFLKREGDGPLTLAASRGFAVPPTAEQVGEAPECCACRETLEASGARLVDGIPTCLLPCSEALVPQGWTRHLCIPLKAKEKGLGVMGVAFRGDRSFADDEIQLLTSIGRQVAVAIENARLYEKIRSKEILYEHVLEKLIRAHEDERTRISRELHDGAGQDLTALLMWLGNLENMIPAEAEAARHYLTEVEILAAAIVEEIRRLMLDLRPALLDELGLIPAVSSHAEIQLAQAGVQVHVAVSGARRKLPSALETALFRIMQEAITNIARHAAAAHVHIGLCFKESSVEATIRDDGCGFDPVGSHTNWQALGLLGIEERVALLGGVLRIDSGQGRGTLVAVEIPTPAWKRIP